MTQIKVDDLSDAALDWVANVCAGCTPEYRTNEFGYVVLLTGVNYSSNADDGMKLLEREINLIERDAPGLPWHAVRYAANGDFNAFGGAGWHAFGATPLIAATRCWIKSVRGDVVDVPEDLLQTPAPKKSFTP